MMDIIIELEEWAFDEALKGNRTKASVIYRVARRMYQRKNK